MGRFFWVVMAGLAMCGAAEGQPPQLKSFKDEKAFVAAVGPGVLYVSVEGQGRWTVVPAPNGRIFAIGQTTREMLQKGQSILCEVTLDDAGKASAPVTKVVCTSGGGAGVTMPVAEGADVPMSGQPAPRGKRPAGTYVVAGPILKIAGDIVTVMAGKERVEIQVAEDATFLVNTPNIGLAALGDQVEMEGLSAQNGQLQATYLKVKLSNPVVPPQKGKPRSKVAAP